jgi:peptide/nickel transport system permease protein
MIKKVKGKKGPSSIQMLKKSPTAMAGMIIVIMVVFSAILAPWISPYNPSDTDLYSRMKPPSAKHLFGTDKLGRDVFSRIVWGARVSLKVGVISVGIGMTIGVLLGLVAGYFGRIFDSIIFSFMDLLISFPAILLAIAIVAALGPGIVQVMVAVGISMVPRFARVTRGSVLSVKEQNFILAAKAIGASHLYVMFRYILPNILTPIVVLATLNCAFALIMEAALSFLGIGIQPPDPTWGSILSDGRSSIRTATWISTFSGLAITVTVLGFNLLGDGLRDILDPKMKRVIQIR